MNSDSVNDILRQVDTSLLTQAFTHKSYANEHSGVLNNECLEFLGDSVLGFVVTAYLYNNSNRSERDLHNMRAFVISEKRLASVARKLSFERRVLLGKGEERSKGRTKTSILCNVFEAVIAAIYIDLGLQTATSFIENAMKDELNEVIKNVPELDWKKKIAKFAKDKNLGEIEYEFTETQFGQQNKHLENEFNVRLNINAKVLSYGSGKSKKDAKNDAAKSGYEKIIRSKEKNGK